MGDVGICTIVASVDVAEVELLEISCSIFKFKAGGRMTQTNGFTEYYREVESG